MIECVKFKSYKNGHLQGFADLFVDKWGLVVPGCCLYMKDGRRWVEFPGKEYIDDRGEKMYSSVVYFRKKEHKKLFCEAAKKAIDDYCRKNPND